MTRTYLTFILIFLCFQADVCAQENSELFTIYLVRHSEKDLASHNSSDPPLTQCGERRSEKLNSFLSHVHLDAIYSTDFSRTQNTALPTARSKGLEIEEYNPRDLKDFSKLLIDCKEDALVVGHSNTTGVLAGLLIGEELEEIDLDVYNRIYQVVLYQGSGRLHLLQTAFECNE